jgi:FlaA1/EpsC-like NDP-sugar epimerase
MFDFLEGKTVLVTGGCGTVGHELARQMRDVPGLKHVVFSRNEAAQFRLQQIYPEIDCYLGDIKNKYDIERVFRAVRPDVVIHAAAVKVVPVAEKEMVHTFETNAMGTYFIAQACLEYGVEVALTIGTDKQCAPVNVYGMCKHIASSIFSDYNRQGKTRFCSVRYGNVLCSRSSLGVIIMEQAEAGKNLTVTDPDMTRFFFTIQEGVALIRETLENAYRTIDYDYYGETVSTQMCAVSLGDLMDIVAEKFGVGVDVIGRRPGEKTHEDLLAPYELKDTWRASVQREPWYATDAWLDKYITVPHSENSPWNIGQFGTDTVYSSSDAPRLRGAEIWDILEFAYKNTWKD